MQLKHCREQVANNALTAAISVHKAFGPGLLESVYEKALIHELQGMGLKAERQVEIPVAYKGKQLGVGFKADIVVEDSLLLQLEAVEELTEKHTARLMTYLKLLRYRRGYLLNVNEIQLTRGIKKVSI